MALLKKPHRWREWYKKIYFLKQFLENMQQFYYSNFIQKFPYTRIGFVFCYRNSSTWRESLLYKFQISDFQIRLAEKSKLLSLLCFVHWFRNYMTVLNLHRYSLTSPQWSIKIIQPKPQMLLVHYLPAYFNGLLGKCGHFVPN